MLGNYQDLNVNNCTESLIYVNRGDIINFKIYFDYKSYLFLSDFEDILCSVFLIIINFR